MEDLTHLQWEDPGWLEPLHRQNVLDYFMNSPFFDPDSNNMAVRKAGRNPAEPGALEAQGAGVEFVVSHAQEPHLFIVCRQLRDAKGRVQPQAYYYIIDRKVYQAPSLHAAVTTRLQRCLFNMQQAFCKLQHDLDPLAQLRQQQQRREQDPEAAAAREAAVAKKPMPVRQKLTPVEADRWRRFDNMIIDVLRKNPAPQLPPEYYQAAAAQPQLAAASQPVQAANGTAAAAAAEGKGTTPEPAAVVADTPPAKRQRV